MGIDVDFFEEHLEKILAFYGTSNKEATNQYREVLYGIVKNMKPEMWSDICSQLLLKLDKHKKPMPKDFLEAERFLLEKKRLENPREARKTDNEQTPEEKRAWCLAEARRLKPKGAKYVLELNKSQGSKLPKEYVDILEATVNAARDRERKVEERKSEVDGGLSLV